MYKLMEVTNMASMFYNCSALTSIDLSKFNTGKVTAMSYMFSGCKSLKGLDLTEHGQDAYASFQFFANT